MSNDLNRYICTGRLTRDPESKSLPSGAEVCNFSLAVSGSEADGQGGYRERVDFVDMAVFGKKAKACVDYLKKGRMVAIEGRLRLEKWETKEGQKRSALRVVASDVKFLDSKNEREPQAEAAADEYGDAALNDSSIPF